jgi:hypothetical protein
VKGQRCSNCGSEYKVGINACVDFRAMSPARTPHPDPNAEARQRRHATAKAKKLLREGMARLQTVLDDRFIIDETPLEASDAMQLAADAMRAALHQFDTADSMGRPGAAAPAATRAALQVLTQVPSWPRRALSWLRCHMPEARIDATHAACDGPWVRDLPATTGPFVLPATGPACSDVAALGARISSVAPTPWSSRPHLEPSSVAAAKLKMRSSTTGDRFQSW